MIYYSLVIGINNTCVQHVFMAFHLFCLNVQQHLWLFTCFVTHALHQIKIRALSTVLQPDFKKDEREEGKKEGRKEGRREGKERGKSSQS